MIVRLCSAGTRPIRHGTFAAKSVVIFVLYLQWKRCPRPSNDDAISANLRIFISPSYYAAAAAAPLYYTVMCSYLQDSIRYWYAYDIAHDTQRIIQSLVYIYIDHIKPRVYDILLYYYVRRTCARTLPTDFRSTVVAMIWLVPCVLTNAVNINYNM